MINRQFFFDQVRMSLFAGHMAQSQVDGMGALLDHWENSLASSDDRWLAYALGTTFHETARTMQPIEEFGKGQGKPYGVADPQTGKIYFGRGFVQLTWKDNYAKMGTKLGIDLVNNPELALDLTSATEILFRGMIDGDFTGRKLGQYFSPSQDNWIDARVIINGHDHAGQIAEYGHKFYAGISYKTG